jgi:hypothetical protein
MAKLGDDNIDDLELSGVHPETVAMLLIQVWSFCFFFVHPLLCLVM